MVIEYCKCSYTLLRLHNLHQSRAHYQQRTTFTSIQGKTEGDCEHSWKKTLKLQIDCLILTSCTIQFTNGATHTF